jgi:hypothetical protein
MGSGTRSARRAAAPALAAMGAISVALGLTAPMGADYGTDGGPAIEALVHGHLGDFAARQPLMGSFSLLVRAPFAALAEVLGGGERLTYQLGVIPCALAAGLLGLWLARALAEGGRSSATCALVAGICLLNPVTFSALYYGHPEEMLGGALCVGAVVAAARGRPGAAGLLLGLAVATKQWALLAVGPVLVAAPGQRLRLGALAAAVVGVLTVPLVLADSGSFVTASGNAAVARNIVLPDCLWWPLATPAHGVVDHIAGQPVIDRIYVLPAWVTYLSHPLIIALAVPLTWPLLRRRGADALGLLVVLFLLRCLLDPWNNGYYHVPFLLALVAWESTRRRGLPLVSLAAAVAMTLESSPVLGARSPDLHNLTYLAWTLPLLAHVALAVYRGERDYSTVTVLARLRGWSTLSPRSRAIR